VAAAAVLFAACVWYRLNADWIIARFGSKELAIAAAIFVGGMGYFVCAFLFRAVTIREVRAAFRKERGAPAGGGGLAGGFD
jgi:putative peptidoglycan lipid II flippase